jgi:ABC-2 type transport system permease protein
MRNIWTIAKREYNHYVISPIAYAVGLMIMVILGFIFYLDTLAAVTYQNAPTLSIVISPLITLFLFTLPAFTMRTIAEEQKQGTMETILTAPVRDAELVIGKWLGAVLFGLTIIAMTLIFPLILNSIIKPGIDQGLMIAEYLGVILLLCSITAIGVFASSLFSNQIAAFFTTIGILLLLWMISSPAQLATTSSTGIEILKYLDMSQHYYNSFANGVVQLNDIVYYISLTVFSLFLGTMSVESRRWR